MFSMNWGDLDQKILMDLAKAISPDSYRDRKDAMKFPFTESCHAGERGISDFGNYEMLRLSFITF